MGGTLRVDSAELGAAAGILGSVTGEFVSTGDGSIGSIGVGGLGHEGLMAAVADFSEQARRVAVNLDACVTGVRDATAAGAEGYEHVEQANASSMGGARG